MNWYELNNIDTIDSPALLLYKERIQQNIDHAIAMIKDVERLRPHVKTNKTAETCAMMMAAGISKFKCATIAEAEMLGMLNAKDVLLAYQPVGPKAKRLLSLVLQYPQTTFGCLVDNLATAKSLSNLFSSADRSINVYIDINSGMNRSGIKTAEAFALAEQLFALPGIQFKGLHAYDGHLRDTDLEIRQQKSNAAFDEVL
ncbi:MAG: alanine racemase, partial [Lacibacter sp.]